MRQEKEATKCIQELNGKELKGATISVELVTTCCILTLLYIMYALLYCRLKEALH